MAGEINNIPNRQYIPMKFVPSNGANLPSREQLKENVTTNVNENPTVKASDGMRDPKVMAGALCLWPALMTVVKPINKSISGEYKSSMLGKIGTFGDNLYTRLHLDNVVNTTKATGIGNFLKTNRFTKYFTKDYAAKPSISLVRSLGTKSELAGDALGILKEIHEKNPAINLKDFFNPKMLKDLGLAGEDALKGANPADYVDDLAVGLHKMAEHCKANGIPEGFTMGKFLKRHIRLSELRNKLITIAPNQTKKALEKAGIDTANMVAKTPLGKGMAKGTLRTLEGLTNGMAGGPAGTILQAFCFAQAIKEAHDAPKGEKLSTFMHVVVNDLGSYLLFASSKDLVYQLAGNKYRGMTKEGISAFREFLSKVNTSELTKEGLKIAKAQKKLFLKGVSADAVKQFGETVAKNPSAYKSAMKDAMKGATKLKFWEHPLKFAGKIIGGGLDAIKAGPMKKFPKLSGVAGGALRFGLVMFVAAPLLLKPITKLCHKIFGEPKTYLAKEKGNKDNKQPQQVQAQEQKEPVNAMDLIKQYQNNDVQQVSFNPQQQYTNVQPENLYNDFIAQNSGEDVSGANPLSKSTRRYIPSSEAPVFETEVDTQAIDDLMKRGEIIEKRAMQYLK
ncbi:hypothetical protein IKQ26_05430 [bacterium]|nr:hypothetical protein [bacterium]